MAKKAQFYATAEELYIVYQMTLEAIAKRLNLAEKTVRTWKTEGDWEQKRSEFTAVKARVSANTYKLGDMIIMDLITRMEAGEKIEVNEFLKIGRTLKSILSTQQFEDIVNKAKAEANVSSGTAKTPNQLMEEALNGLFGTTE